MLKKTSDRRGCDNYSMEPHPIIIPAKAFARDYVITGVVLSVRLPVSLLPR